jgi:uncharacterized protein
MRLRFPTAVLFCALTAASRAQAPAPALHWQSWSGAVFAQARAEHKFVLLDLEAVWCHWCHVMDDVTYKDPAVTGLLNAHYLLIKVDQDSRPDISNRYGDWGWPATIVFAADGSEIVKRQGYIPPRPMSSLLQAIIDDPSPGPSVVQEAAFHPAADSILAPALLARVRGGYEKQYDTAAAGWGYGHKYLDAASVELALRLAAGGNATYAQRASLTLHNAIALIDPVWGGMDQYSVDGVWNEPHYEKLISIQADALREYSLAWAQTGAAEDMAAAQSVHRFVTNFLTAPDSGAFYVSQDADLRDGEDNEAYFRLSDAERRREGLPRIDTHIYARENGWAIAALCTYYAASGDSTALAQAQRAARWIAAHRAIPGGGFRHGDADPAGPYLADTLAMGQGFLALYNVTGDRRALQSAESAARFIAGHFRPTAPGTGFVTSPTPTDTAYRPHPDRDENISLVRFTSMLAFITGDASFHATAAEAMRYLAAESIAIQPLSAGILLADEDATQAPLHVTIVGATGDPATAALRTAALRSIASHELIELRDPADPHPQPTAIAYPRLSRPALFLCTATACSSPLYDPTQVHAKIERAEQQTAH